jgi:hypothetical protein
MSEGNVVLEIIESTRGRLIIMLFRFRWFFPSSTLPAKHLHLVSTNLGGIAILALLVFPLSSVDRTFDIDQ